MGTKIGDDLVFNLKDICDDGFKGDDRELALISLKTALKAYFSTYQAIKYNIIIFKPTFIIKPERIDLHHLDSYREVYAETIVHFQHFIELICKEILREDHELFAVDATNKPEVYHKLLKGEIVNPLDFEQLKTIKFSDALDRLCKLIKAGRIGSTKYGFILKNRPMLDELNNLRNRIWHRGTYILRYPALDKLIGCYVLPFVKEVISLDNFKDKESIWKYKKLDCSIDPIEVIIDEFNQGKYELKKIAILKELGRAAYENPLSEFSFALFDAKEETAKVKFDEEFPEITEYDRTKMADVLNLEVKKCPVCGINTLLIRKEETEDYDDVGNTIKIWRFHEQIKCMCCSFSLQYDVGKPSAYGLNLDDYWYEEKLS